jgi:hypothetical protein
VELRGIPYIGRKNRIPPEVKKQFRGHPNSEELERNLTVLRIGISSFSKTKNNHFARLETIF